MIDLLCHILPGVDDGARTLEESITMARYAVKEGITHVLATPHHMSGAWRNEKQTIAHLVEELQTELDARNIPLTVFPGQEVRIYDELLEDIEKNKIQFIDEQNRYLLIAFPPTEIPRGAGQLIFDLQVKGIIPVIVHPELNKAIQQQPRRLKRLVDKGALVQLTAGSYTGSYGKQVKKLSSQLIAANLVHFIASDAHDNAFQMKKAYRMLEKEYSEDRVEEFERTTKLILNGEYVVPPEPQSIVQSKSFFGLF